ncbi:MAG: DUF624 domain-containing protein [Lachnospiraceae bacterium]|nr:DUF624 domain-containing protein [Lachnospiraceae bacterium]
MGNLFNPDNKVMVFLSHVTDYIILSLIWTVCSIPVFTIGASTTAFYYTSLKILDGKDTYVTKDFFHSFKQNFKQATLLWLTFLGVGIFLVVDILIYRQMDTTFANVAIVIFASVSLMYVFTLLYLFPYLSKFYCTFKQAIKSALLLSLRHLGYTILMIIADVVIVFAAMYYSFLIMFLPAIFTFVNSLIFKRIFKRYIPEDTQTADDDSFSTIDEIEMRDAEAAAAAAVEEENEEVSDDSGAFGSAIESEDGVKRYF